MANYATEAEGDTYFTTRLSTTAWDDASTADRTAALTMATEIIDRLNFVGSKYDADQVNQFPRGTDTTVPSDIQKACLEISLALLDGVNPDLEFENLFMTQQGYGGVKSSYDRNIKQAHILAGVPSFVAWTYLRPYLIDPYTVDLGRTS
jgi:hypothetical protein